MRKAGRVKIESRPSPGPALSSPHEHRTSPPGARRTSKHWCAHVSLTETRKPGWSIRPLHLRAKPNMGAIFGPHDTQTLSATDHVGLSRTRATCREVQFVTFLTATDDIPLVPAVASRGSRAKSITRTLLRVVLEEARYLRSAKRHGPGQSAERRYQPAGGTYGYHQTCNALTFIGARSEAIENGVRTTTTKPRLWDYGWGATTS